MKKLLLIIVAAVLGIYFGFIHQGKLKGNVFITTKGGNTITLSSAEVYVIPTGDFLNHQRGFRSAISDCPHPIDKLKKIDSFIESGDMEGLADYEEQFEDCGYENVVINQAKIKSRTDKNGDFEVVVPRHQKLVLVVRASRAVFGETEMYNWYIPVKLGFSFERNYQLDVNNMTYKSQFKEIIDQILSL